ncbi:coiled-coil domain-containing protein [Sandaracinobacteroides hominis]|uniref:hypothetical protein n=1 Tax=Sandaracinobacteroides hominis TaxID=2780086 RepID=UPI0018F65AE7|nr:hypothetical protein [Sandaracinobacteroides hominis]
MAKKPTEGRGGTPVGRIVGKQPVAGKIVATKAAAGKVAAGKVSDKAKVIAGKVTDKLGDRPVIVERNPPVFRLNDPVQNLFKRAGGSNVVAVVRPDDLAAIRIELNGLNVTGGASPRLKKTGSGAAHLILHFQPQAIVEQAFFETQATYTNPTNPQGDIAPSPPADFSETPGEPPVRARISGESRLSFAVPDGFDIEWSLASVLEAVRTLAPNVAANAKPRTSRFRPIIWGDIFVVSKVKALHPKLRGRLASFSVRSARIGAAEDTAGILAGRISAVGGLVRPIDVARIPGIRFSARPALPSATTTSIELPFRLIISPHEGERFQHATAPVVTPGTGRTELWHTRLVGPKGSALKAIEPPHPDSNRTIRAIWALTGESSPPDRPMQGNWPDIVHIPPPSNAPFRMPMNDFDRFQIAHLSSNFSVGNYVPEPIDANLLMLSALGGWLDSKGGWNPPGLSVEEWVHRASMARDHYVRIVYKGFLYPFGHRVSLVKVTERKFHSPPGNTVTGNPASQYPGNIAYLRQRLFMIVRERERHYDEAALGALRSNDNKRSWQRQFPFASVRILTQTTPNLDPPDLTDVEGLDQQMFWPAVGGQPFKFSCVGIDLDGSRIAFDMPMIFVDNMLACPRTRQGNKLVPQWNTAETYAEKARKEYNSRLDRRSIPMKGQRVALAGSFKPGDTAVESETIVFNGEAEANNAALRAASDRLNRPLWFPKLDEVRARIGALAKLGGTDKSNLVGWNAWYLDKGFVGNKGEVFVDVKPEGGMAMLDFSAQGDRSGGYVQPNLKPSALSRLAGPVMGNVDKFVQGQTDAGAGFPTSISDLPLPLLFGCIPLGEIIKAVLDLTDTPDEIPKFASEAANDLEAFVSGLSRLYGFISDIAAQPSQIGEAATAVFKALLEDLKQQGLAYAQAQMAPVNAAIQQATAALGDVASKLEALKALVVDVADSAPSLGQLPGSIATARTRLQQLKTAANAQVAGQSLPSGLRQSILGAVQTIDDFLADLELLPAIISAGKSLYAALDAIFSDPGGLGELFEDPAAFAALLDDVAAALGGLRPPLESFDLLDGAPKNTILGAMQAVEEALESAADIIEMLANLLGEEMTIRFDWNPRIESWWLPGANKATDDPIFRANDQKGFLVAVEAKVKKSGGGTPKIGVTCGLKHFDLVLIAPASFLELNFEKIEFTIDSSAKMDVDVLLNDIKFVGPLSFVETLKDLIPLDGFSDPPYLDISAQGIDAGFDIELPGISIGVMSLTNLSLGAGFTVPFIGQPLSVRFNFCKREQPFTLTVYIFGGGGFFGVTIDPNGVQILEAAFEFGAAISIDFGVASGGVSVMAGIYFRMEQDAASLTGYFRLEGHVDVLGLITASLELYLELRYEFQSGKCVGKAELTIEISLFIFSGSVTITCERKFAGSNGDPSLRDMLGFQPAMPLEQELAAIDDDTEYAWRDHIEAFA